MKKKLFIAFVLCSLLFNFIFFSISIYPYVENLFYNSFTSYARNDINNKDFEKLILAGAEKRLASDIVFDNDYYPTVSPVENFKNLFLKEDIIAYEFGEHGYLMWCTLKVARSINDKDLIAKIKGSFDKTFLKQDFKGINKVDQSIYGCVSLELFKEYNDQRYIVFADSIFNYLNEIDKKNGLITYNQGEEQHVDLLGFVCPFLSEYAKSNENSGAKKLCIKIVDDFAENGVDDVTGIPAQGYNIKTKVKIGYSNWGRGISWYTLAVSSVDEKDLKEDSQRKILLLKNTLKKYYYKGLFTQFVGKNQVNEKYDMSVQIPITNFLYTEGLIKLNSRSFIKKIGGFVTDEGLIVYNSPTITSGRKSSEMLCHDMTQGILVSLFSKLK
jgi:hypothetical protein